MKAVRLYGKNDVRIVEIERPKPNPGEVLIKIGAAGVCHSDLHLIHQGLAPEQTPFTLGHENAGWVTELGAGVRGFEAGEAVMVYGPWGCGHCAPCQRSEENYCDHQSASSVLGGGLGRDGGMADYMLVPDSRLLVKLGDLQPQEVAPLTDAALTPYHAIRRSADKITPDATILAIGIGGLGHMALQLLKQCYGARVIAGDINDAKLQLAAALGAEACVRTDRPDALQHILALTGEKRCALVLDFVGNEASLALGAQAVGINGDFTVVGLAGGKLSQPLPWGARLCTPYWGSRVELMDVLALKRRKVIEVNYSTYPLTEALSVYQLLQQGKISGRAVLQP